MVARLRSYSPQIALVFGAALLSWACSGPGDDAGANSATTLTSIIDTELNSASPATTTDSTSTAAPTSTAASTSTTAEATTTAPIPASTAPIAPLQIDENSFVALSKMTPIRGFFVDNLLGDLDLPVQRSG